MGPCHLGHNFWQLRTLKPNWVDPPIKSDIGQHSQLFFCTMFYFGSHLQQQEVSACPAPSSCLHNAYFSDIRNFEGEEPLLRSILAQIIVIVIDTQLHCYCNCYLCPPPLLLQFKLLLLTTVQNLVIASPFLSEGLLSPPWTGVCAKPVFNIYCV